MILGAHVNELNAPEVGEIEGVLTFFSHCLVIAAMAFVISLSDVPRRQRVLRPLYVFAAGVVAVAAFGFFLSWNSLSTLPDSTGGLKGIARADFLGKRAGSMDSDRKLIRDGVLYKVYDWQTVHYVIVSRGKDFAFEVPVPFPNGAAKRDMIVGLAKSEEVQRLFGLPRRGWEIAWVDRDLEPYTQPTLIFRLRRPIEEVDAFGVDEMLQQATRTSVATVHFREVVDVLLQIM